MTNAEALISKCFVRGDTVGQIDRLWASATKHDRRCQSPKRRSAGLTTAAGPGGGALRLPTKIPEDPEILDRIRR
jgi:hypothetical protein